MNFVLAVSTPKIIEQLKMILEMNSHEIGAVCFYTHTAIDYVELIRPDICIMENDLTGKYQPSEVTKYFNDVFNIPVVYIINNSAVPKMKQLLESKPYGIITDPGDTVQVNYTLELAYNKFEESLYLL